MMDIKWDECGRCYSWQPAEYIYHGLCGGCTMAAGKEETQPPVVPPATQTRSEGIASVEATADAGHSEQGGGAS
jgi:hypothetical protein